MNKANVLTYSYCSRLLDQLNYNPDNDLLIALGDVVNKGEVYSFRI